MNDGIKQNIRERKVWLRGLYMLLFLIFYSVAKVIVFAVIIFQFLITLVTGSSNERLVELGNGLSMYLYQILLFLTFNNDQHPYPFSEWPKGAANTSAIKAPSSAKKKTKKQPKKIEKDVEKSDD